MNQRLVIVADENIAAAEDAFAQFGEVRLYPGRAISRKQLADADALIVRSVTEVDEALLEGTGIRFVGTATIGRDHLDEEYLWKRDIRVVDAAGGGARSVAEYAVTATYLLKSRKLLDLRRDQVGVVGVGAIGQMVVDLLGAIGVNLVTYDPPRAERDPDFVSCSLDDVHRSRCVILAVPLTEDGEYPTLHMVDQGFIGRLRPGSCIINVARGGVVETGALAAAMASGEIHAVLDVWEDEPAVDPMFLKHAEIATPHIAGYSRDGKLRGTQMMTQGLADFLGTEDGWDPSTYLEEAGIIKIGKDLDPEEGLLEAMLTACPLIRDDRALRTLFPLSSKQRTNGFDFLRKNYPVRREFPAWQVSGGGPELMKLGFRSE